MIADKEFYEDYALHYPDDLVIRGSQLATIQKHIDYEGKTGLDIGSANGALAIELAKDGAKHVYGIDLAEQFVKQSKAQAQKQGIKNVTFKQADAKDLPFKDNTFDFITCTEVLEHVPDFREAIIELRRVLKPGGQFLITVPNSLCPAEIAHQGKHGIMWVLKKEAITHINLFFLPTVHKYYAWAHDVRVFPLHFVLPFFPKKYINHFLVKLDLVIGSVLRPLGFDIVIVGRK